MMSTTSVSAQDITRRTIEIYDAQEFDRIDEVLADDFQVRVVGMTFTGHDEVRGMLTSFYTAFPDLVHHLEAVIETTDPDETVFEIRVTATHRGPYQGPAGELPATGNAIEWFSGNVIRSQGGKLKSWNIYLDQVPVLTQVGYEFK
jgi:ketosteroid isomerase-like protein